MARGLLLVLVLASLGAGVYWWQGRSEATAARRERAPVLVTTITVEPRPLRDRVTALGTLKAWESVDIASREARLVDEVLFDDGDRVEAGELLARLRQEEEQATLRELEARLRDGEREVRRLEDLARRKQVAQSDLDAAVTEVAIVREQIGAMRARLEDLNVRAPFAGVLGLREVSPGALVSAGQRLTTLDDLSRMRLDFSVPSRQLAFVSVGQRVTATTAALPGTFPGEVTAIDSRIDPVARSVNVRAVLANPGEKLRPGLLMEVEVRGDERPALMVPEESLLSRTTRHFVWRVQDGRAFRTEVQLGARIPGWVEIAGGLDAGDHVVRDGIIRLSGDGPPVREADS